MATLPYGWAPRGCARARGMVRRGFTTGAGFSLSVRVGIRAPAKISMLGPSVSGIDVASTFSGSGPFLFESSGMTVGSGAMLGTASCALANGGWESATPMHTTSRRIPARDDGVLCCLAVRSNKWSVLPFNMFLSFLVGNRRSQLCDCAVTLVATSLRYHAVGR